MYFPITEEETNLVQRYRKEIRDQRQDSAAVHSRRKKQWKPFCYIVNTLWNDICLHGPRRSKILEVKKMANIKFEYTEIYQSERYSVIYEDEFHMMCRTSTHNGEQVRIFKKHKIGFFLLKLVFYSELACYEIKLLEENKFKIQELNYRIDYNFMPLFAAVKEYYFGLIQDAIDRNTAINAYADLVDNIFFTGEKTNG
ncbi:MAG: hypothetical protein LBK66_05260 [Spirochaetaceae bacterium]|jgi:hypothetical protein|nr:hypothetical protein [Spirochaetaceae bacterium]